MIRSMTYAFSICWLVSLHAIADEPLGRPISVATPEIASMLSPRLQGDSLLAALNTINTLNK